MKKLWLIILAALLAGAVPAAHGQIISAFVQKTTAPVTFVRAASSGTEQSSNTTGTLSFNGTGCEFLVVWLTTRGGTVSAPSATYNSVSMSLVSGSPWMQSGANSISAFSLINPSSGTNTISVSWTSSHPFALGAQCVAGGSHTIGTPQVAGNASTNSLTTTTPSTISSLVLSATTNSAPATPTLASGTQDWSFSPSGGGHQSGTSSVSTTWNMSGTDVMLMVAFSVN